MKKESMKEVELRGEKEGKEKDRKKEKGMN